MMIGEYIGRNVVIETIKTRENIPPSSFNIDDLQNV